MTPQELKELYQLLKKFRDDSVDRDEWDRRNGVLFDVQFELAKEAA